MAAVMVFVLTAVACMLFSARRRHSPGGHGNRVRRLAGARVGPAQLGLPWPVRRGGAEVSMPRLVRQLSALLASGQSGPVLWAALAGVLATEPALAGYASAATVTVLNPVHLPGQGAGQFPGRNASQFPGRNAAAADHPTLALVLAVQRASALGLPTAEAVRNACRQNAAPTRSRRSRWKSPGLSPGQVKVWQDLAACLEVCEASGAPVAAVLSRLADRLETELDTAEQRETALAGPRATVRLLTWLPFIGLGLGLAMGVDPFGVLLGTPPGWSCLAAGLALVAAGRWWSRRLITAAARPPSHHEGVPRGSTPVAMGRPASTGAK